MKRSWLVITVLVSALVLGSLGYAWKSRESLRSPSVPAQSVSIPGGAEAKSSETSPSDETGNADAGSDAEAVISLMAEIEATATGDEDALEGEYAAESESFMEGAVVMEQLGTIYDETIY